MVAGKRAPGAVGSVHAGREPHDEKSRRRIAEWRYRTAIVILMIGIDRIEKLRQSRAGTTISVKYRVIHVHRPPLSVTAAYAGG